MAAATWPSQSRPKPSLTELAKKYTHPTGPGHEILATKYFLKSGLTPLNLTTYATIDEYLYHWMIDGYQGEQFDGFTTAELRNLDAFAPSIDDPVDLTLDGLPIHPLYARENWTKTPRLKHNPGYLVGDSINDGYYDATNPVVWKAIVPALRLTSQILMNAHSFAWYDALFFGPLEDIPSSQIHDAWQKFPCKYRRFRLRAPYISGSAEARQKLEERLARASKIIHFSFCDGRDAGPNATPGLGGACIYGWVLETNNPVLFMSTQSVKSLLNPRLTSAERALDTFRFATILAHETVHALHRAQPEHDRDLRDDKYGLVEPYFEDEPISELGWSLENAVFGGQPGEITGRVFAAGGGPSSGAIVKQAWPDWSSDFPEEPNPWLNGGLLKSFKHPDWWRHAVSPIPCSYSINLHNPDYWYAYSRRYGTMRLELGPETVVREIVLDPATTDVTKEESKATAFNFQRILNQPYIQITNDMSPAAIIEAKLENQRRAEVEVVNQKLFSAKQALQVFGQTHDPVKLQAYEAANAGRRAPILPPYEPEPECPQFHHIQKYLFRNRLQLALDTMTKLPENLMYHYILENGGLNISVSTWRSFLLVCTRRHILFEWLDQGSGQIRRNPQAWPTSTLPDRPRPPGRKPNDTIFEIFHRCADNMLFNKPEDRIISIWDPFATQLYDHDLEDFRQRICAEYSRLYDKPVRTGFLGRPAVFDRRTMDLILYYCDREASNFIYGPKGIIRSVMHGDGNNPVQPNDAFNEQKVKPGGKPGCKQQ